MSDVRKNPTVLGDIRKSVPEIMYGVGATVDNIEVEVKLEDVSTMAMIYIRGIVGDAVKLALEQDCQQPGEGNGKIILNSELFVHLFRKDRRKFLRVKKLFEEIKKIEKATTIPLSE